MHLSIEPSCKKPKATISQDNYSTSAATTTKSFQKQPIVQRQAKNQSLKMRCVDDDIFDSYDGSKSGLFHD